MRTQAESFVLSKLPGLSSVLSLNMSKPVFRYAVSSTGPSPGVLPHRYLRTPGPKAKCCPIPEEKKLVRKITIDMTEFGFDNAAKKWKRNVKHAAVNIDNVGGSAGYPLGYKEPCTPTTCP